MPRPLVVRFGPQSRAYNGQTFVSCRHTAGGAAVPESLDWRGTGAVGVVKDQVRQMAPLAPLRGARCMQCSFSNLFCVFSLFSGARCTGLRVGRESAYKRGAMLRQGVCSS